MATPGDLEIDISYIRAMIAYEPAGCQGTAEGALHRAKTGNRRVIFARNLLESMQGVRFLRELRIPW